MDGLIRFIFSLFSALLTLFILHKLIPKLNKHSKLVHGIIVLYLSLFLTFYSYISLLDTLVYYASLILIIKWVYRNSSFVASMSVLILYLITLLGSMVTSNLSLLLFAVKVDYRAVFASGCLNSNILFFLSVYSLLKFYQIIVKVFKKVAGTNFKFDIVMIFSNVFLFGLVFAYQKLTFLYMVAFSARGVINAPKSSGFDGYFLLTYGFVTTMSLILVVLINRLFIVDKNLERYKIKAETDVMTGVLSREAGLTHLKTQMSQAIAFKQDLTIAYIDVNDLKIVNDGYGHKEGDQLLRTISDIIQSKLREFDIVARLGGDEFLVVFTRCNRAQAQRVWRRITEEFLKVNVEGNIAYKISASAGITQFIPTKHTSLLNFVHEADEEMYAQKKKIKESLL